MARRKSFTTIMKAVARESARAAREAEREQRRREKLQMRRDREAAKQEKLDYLEDRLSEVEDLNEELNELITSLKTILEHTLTVNDCIAFDCLRVSAKVPKAPEFPDYSEREPAPRPPWGFAKLFPGSTKRYEEAVESYERRKRQYEREVQDRLDEHKRTADALKAKAKQRNAEIEELERTYFLGESEAVEVYCTLVLERSDYPVELEREFRVCYAGETKQLVIEYLLPTIDVVPEEEEYRYVKSKDEITSKARKLKERKDIYSDLVAAIALRTIHEVIEADQANVLETVAFNGYVKTRDPSTGKEIQPCLVSVRTTKQAFLAIDLAHVNRAACLKSLGAHVSGRPDELIAVKPIVEFNMVDKRFVEQGDVLSELEARPNLMELTPTEFENLVSNLFQQLGLEAKLTRSSKDGGVDCVAFDTRPVLGGKVVIQAKRYKHTVGVSAVRDLYGTMQHEGANKGILVTTSGYGTDAFDFAKDKPIELIAGGQLLYLLEQVGISARIVMPEEAGVL